MKTCTKCGETKPLTEFPRAGGGGRRARCHVCSRQAWKIYGASPSGRQTARRAKLKHLYGITPEEYDALLEKQGGCCAICKSSTPLRFANFSVDHDHETGRVRGLLCLRCNNWVGWFEKYRDDLAAYLGK